MDMMNITEAPAMAMLAEGDIEAGRRFWRDTLGYTEIDYDVNQRTATYRSGSTWFGVYQYEGGSTCGHTQLAFSVTDVDSVVQGLRQKGVTFQEYDLSYLKTVNGVASMPDGSKAAWFKDPGNNIIGLFQLSPQAAQKMQSEMTMVGATH